MTDKKQSAVARRLAKLNDAVIIQNETTTNQLISQQVNTNTLGISNLNSEVYSLQNQNNNLASSLQFQLDDTQPTSLMARVIDLENNPSGGGGGIDPTDPTQPILIVENFLNLNNGDRGDGVVIPYSYPTVSPTLLNNFSFTVTAANSEPDHLGIIELEPFESVVCGFALGSQGNEPLLRFGDLNTTTLIFRTAGIKDTFFRFGLNNDLENTSGIDQTTNGIYFELLSTDTNFFAVTKTSSTQTRTNTGVAWVANTWYILKITRNSSNQPIFTINTTEVTNTTNIPTGFLNLGISVFRNVTNATTYDLDFFSLKLGDVTPVLPTGTTVEGTPNEVEVTSAGSVYTVGLPNSITVNTVNTSQLNFNTTPLAPTNTIGGQYWDTTYNTLSLGLTTNTNLKIGQGLYKYARNTSGSLIPKGKVVYINGHHANTQLTIGLANATTEATSADVIGVTAEDIAHNTSGFVQTFGYLTGFATNTTEILVGQEGKALYLSADTSGDMRTGLPPQPLHGVRVGFLVQRSGTGAMFINVQNYQELEELSDVKITSIANNDVLQWDNTDLRWENRSLATAGIAAASHTHPLSDLTQSSATPNQVPQWNGTNWVPVTLSTGGSPGGSTGQVQYNNASAFAGATNVKINSNNLELVKPASEPTTAPADSIVMYTKSIGQRDLPAFVDSSGWATNLQTCIARNKFSMMNFNAGTTTAPISTGFVYTPTVVGTGNTASGAVTIGTTSLLAGSRRSSFLTANTAGNAAGWRTSVAQCWRGNGVDRGGFFCVWKFGIGDATLQTDATLFVGLNDSTNAPDATAIDNPTTTSNASMRNTVGLVLAGGSTTYTIIHRNGTGLPTTIPLTGFTANLTDIVEFCLYAAPNDSTIHYYVKIYANSGSNQEISNNIGTANIPPNTTLFVPHCWRGRTSLAAAAVAVHCHTFSIEQPH
jgi:hypothetical protein